MCVKGRFARVAAAGFGLLMAVAPLLAHHTFAVQYDSKTLITLQGKIIKIEWKNPHTYLYLETKDAKGKVVNWALEGSAPATNMRSGWQKDTLKKGDIIKVTAYPARDGSNRAAAREVTFADGETMVFGSAGR